MKIITICGSLKFQNEMMKISEEMEFKGNCVLSVIYPVNPDIKAYTKDQIMMLNKMHKERIKLSDAILVVDVNHYIGESTRSEIEFAEALNKEVIYYTDLLKD